MELVKKGKRITNSGTSALIAQIFAVTNHYKGIKLIHYDIMYVYMYVLHLIVLVHTELITMMRHLAVVRGSSQDEVVLVSHITLFK